MPAIQYTYQSPDPNVRPAALLRIAGPYLPVRIGPAMPAGSEAPQGSVRDVTALIDTGSAESCIHDALAAQLALRIVDRRPGLEIAEGRTYDVYLADIAVHATGQRRFAPFVGVKLSEHWPVVLGRDFLTGLVMTYDGINGIVTISG